jgi:hypothetical protein
MPASAKALILAAAFACTASAAHAVVTQRLKNACRDEYFTYCSAYAVGSKDLKRCMRAAQFRFSERCLRELVASGEASKRDVLRYRARKSRKKH